MTKRLSGLTIAAMLFVASALLSSCKKEDKITPVLPGVWTTEWEDETSEFEIDRLTVEEYIRFDEFDPEAGYGTFYQYMKGDIEYDDMVDEASIPYECAIEGRWKVDGDEIQLGYNMSMLQIALGKADVKVDPSDMMGDLVNLDFDGFMKNAFVAGARSEIAAKRINKELETKVDKFFRDYFRSMNDDKEALTDVRIEGNVMTCEVNDGFFNRDAKYTRYGESADSGMSRRSKRNGSSNRSSAKTSSSSPSGSRASSSGAKSLLDIIYDPDAVRSGRTGMKLMTIGNNYRQMLDDVSGSTSQELTVSGMIGDDNFTAECWITEEGELHGRYHNANGTNLDLNGYIRPNGDLLIQLGHGSSSSEWRLSPVASELTDAYRYEGTWGKRNKDSYAVFREK